MACSNPPPLSDEDISTILDGEGTPELRAHLQQCGDCAARFDQAQRFDQALASRLHRWDCPPAQELGDYHLGFTTQARERAIGAHLELCARCTAEVEELRVFLQADLQAPAPAPVPRQTPPSHPPRTIFARLMPRSPSLAWGALRGADDGPLIAESPAATIVLETRQAPPQGVRISGQIADDQAKQERWDGALVEVRQQDQLVAVTFVDDLGGFTTAPVTPTTTQLHIAARDGTLIVVEQIDLAGS